MNNIWIKTTFLIIVILTIYYLIQLPLPKKSVSQFALVWDNKYEPVKIITYNETPHMDNSAHNLLWLNSGAMFYSKENIIYSIQGDLPKYSPWRITYNNSNPTDTDNGYHPQNIFRLITKNTYENNIQSFYVLIINDNLSLSPNRNESNGIFIINRYVDTNNLYYSGIRVDGTAIVKKKENGVYYTLAQTKVFDGDNYQRNTHPSLIPKNKWFGIKTEIKNDNSIIKIKLYLDLENNGVWNEILTTQDISGQKFLTGHNGIRSDFMDIEIKNYTIFKQN